MQRPLELGASRPIAGTSPAAHLRIPASHLVTHAVVTGMTGSGRTGLLTVMVEEALLSRVPVLVVDVKGDLANIGLACDSLSHESLVPWIDPNQPDVESSDPVAIARATADSRRAGLARWGHDESLVQAFSRSLAPSSQAANERVSWSEN